MSHTSFTYSNIPSYTNNADVYIPLWHSAVAVSLLSSGSPPQPLVSSSLVSSPRATSLSLSLSPLVFLSLFCARRPHAVCFCKFRQKKVNLQLAHAGSKFSAKKNGRTYSSTTRGSLPLSPLSPRSLSCAELLSWSRRREHRTRHYHRKLRRRISGRLDARIVCTWFTMTVSMTVSRTVSNACFVFC